MKNYYAILIGVGNDLPVTANDAKCIYSVLSDVKKGSYETLNIDLLIEKDSSKANVIKKLDDLLAKLRNPESSGDSTVVIYYSGHASRYARDNNEFDYYMKTWGSDETNKDETMLNGKIFSEKVNQLNCKKLLVMLDCCHAAGIKEGNLLNIEPSKNPQSVSGKAILKGMDQGKGKIFITACDDDEQSVIFKGAANSLFTQIALDVLNGVTLQDSEFIPAIDLIYNLVTKVPKALSGYNHNQHPVVNCKRRLN